MIKKPTQEEVEKMEVHNKYFNPVKLTHQGEVKVTKYGLNMKWVWRARLRETKRFWIDKNGTKYCKKTGWPPGVTSPVFVLDVSTIVKLT